MHRTVSYDYAACAFAVVCSFRHTGPLKLIMSNVSNAVNGHTMYVWMYLQNCWQEPSRASVPLPYPRTELSIANVHYNSNVLTAKRSTQTLTLLIGFVTALVLPFWPVAILTMNHLSMLVLVHPTHPAGCIGPHVDTIQLCLSTVLWLHPRYSPYLQISLDNVQCPCFHWP